MRIHERAGHPTAEVYELTVEVLTMNDDAIAAPSSRLRSRPLPVRRARAARIGGGYAGHARDASARARPRGHLHSSRPPRPATVQFYVCTDAVPASARWASTTCAAPSSATRPSIRSGRRPSSTRPRPMAAVKLVGLEWSRSACRPTGTGRGLRPQPSRPSRGHRSRLSGIEPGLPPSATSGCRSHNPSGTYRGLGNPKVMLSRDGRQRRLTIDLLTVDPEVGPPPRSPLIPIRRSVAGYHRSDMTDA